MPRIYTIRGRVSTGISTKTVASIQQPSSSLASAIKIRRVKWSSDASADNAFQVTLGRTTTAGTKTAVTPKPYDMDDPASTATGGEKFTAEPTYTSGENLLDLSGHQRVGGEWIAQKGEEIRIPKTASNGVGLLFTSPAVSANVDYVIEFEE